MQKYPINNCQIFIIVLSNHSTTSTKIENEFNLALKANKSIIPIILTQLPIDLTNIKYNLAGLQTLSILDSEGLLNLEQTVAGIMETTSPININVANIINTLPHKKIGNFYIRQTLTAILTTLIEEVPHHLIKLLTNLQEQYYLPFDYNEDALRRLRNHGLLQHDGKWLLTPTQSERVWATVWGDLMIEIYSNINQSPLRFQRLAYEAVEHLTKIESDSKAIKELNEIEKGNSKFQTSSFRTLRNLSLISYKELSSRTPLLNELSRSKFYVTNLGRHVLKTLKNKLNKK